MHNLLNEDLFTVTDSNGVPHNRSLPRLLSDIINGSAHAFPNLRPHQSHPWHAFLVQLAVIATEKARLTTPPEDETTWTRVLSDLTPDHQNREPWHLLIPDPATPAFLQPPVRTLEDFQHYTGISPTPDRIDLLFTSGNHDVKRFIITDATPEDWIFALVATQTSNGYSGPFTYGVSRMNSGSGNRPGISLTPWGASPGEHIRRDIIALLQYLPELRHNHPRFGQSPDAPALFWLMPWDGSKTDQIDLDGLHPLYIEACRRIRLVHTPDGISARRATSKSSRVAQAKENRGITVDPWTPVQLSDPPKSLTIPEGGFTYYHLARHLFSDTWQPPLLARPTQSEQDSRSPMVLQAKALVRGQCETAGYYERQIPIRPPLIAALRKPEDLITVKEIADTMLKVSRAARKCTTGVSKASINVRICVQHKCHFVMPSLYQILTA